MPKCYGQVAGRCHRENVQQTVPHSPAKRAEDAARRSPKTRWLVDGHPCVDSKSAAWAVGTTPAWFITATAGMRPGDSIDIFGHEAVKVRDCGTGTARWRYWLDGEPSTCGAAAAAVGLSTYTLASVLAQGPWRGNGHLVERSH